MKVSATAPGKIILCGEHAVVYGRPAIAVPVRQVQVRAEMESAGSALVIRATNQDRTYRYSDLDSSHPIAAIIGLTLAALGGAAAPNATLTITSTIPIASGLGSGAAVSTAIVRALAMYLERDLPTQAISDLVFQVEKIHHGTPSGIDNTVIAFERPVYFRRGDEVIIKPFTVPKPFTLVIGDTGVSSPTRITVGDVRRGWEADPVHYERLFDRCGEIAEHAYQLTTAGLPDALGPLLTENHTLLKSLGVSSPELDRLVRAALDAGATGAKLSGGGRGGNMIAFVTGATAPQVEQALMQAGARRLIRTVIGKA